MKSYLIDLKASLARPLAISSAIIVAMVILLAIAGYSRPAHAQEASCHKVAELVTDANDQFADTQAKVYTGEEAKRIIAVASEQSGRADALEGADGVTVITSKEAGGGVVAITKGGCVKLVGRGSFDVVDSILKAAKIGGDT